jgi:hypothetical protein
MEWRVRVTVGLLAGVLVLSAAGAGHAAPCAPVTSAAFNVNGVVVGKEIAKVGVDAGGPPADCGGDSGWQGVPAIRFGLANVVPPPPATTLTADMFVVGNVGIAGIEPLFLGIHVEHDDGFSNIDGLILYFDFDGDGQFEAQDFALTIEAGPTSTPADEQCQGCPNNVSIYRFNSMTSTWGPPTLLADACGAGTAGVQVRTSWDYDTATDTDDDIWELELKITPSALSPPVTIASGSQMRVAAKLFDFPVGSNGIVVMSVPGGLTSDGDPNNMVPGEGGGTTSLGAAARIDVGACQHDVEIVSISARSAQCTAQSPAGCVSFVPGAFSRFPNAIAGTLADNLTNEFTAQVRYVDPSNLLGTPVASPNAGTVTLRAMPYNSGFTGDFVTGAFNLQFTSVGQVRTVKSYWPRTESEYTQVQGGKTARQLFNEAAAAAGGHVCFKAELAGFALNSNVANDVRQQNLAIVTASTIKERFLLQAPAPRDGASNNDSWDYTQPHDFLLRTRWDNLPDGYVAPPGQPAKGQWSYAFPNAKDLGLKDLGGGVYSVELKPGEQKLVDVELTGGKMPAAPDTLQLSPRAGGLAIAPPTGEKPVPIAVTPGMSLSIIATGDVQVGPERQPNGPDGFADKRLVEAQVQGNGRDLPRLLMSAGSAYVAGEHVGALIGSFDDFKTAFVIGGAATFQVPAHASTLWLAVNDEAGGYDDNRGQGFEVTVLRTPPSSLPTRLASAGNPNNGLPAAGGPGADFPRFTIDVFGVDAKRRALRPNGYVAWAVYASHEDEGGPAPDPGTGCAAAQTAAPGAAFLMLGVGAVVARQTLRRRRAGKPGPGA